MTHLEKSPGFVNPRLAAVISLCLCLPLIFFLITAAFDYEPPFARLLTETDGYTPTTLGRILMLVMLGSLPAAFSINFLSMLRKADPERPASFRITPAHTLTGMTVLAVILLSMRSVVLYELRPFVNQSGPLSMLAQIVFFLILLPLPTAFLLNRFPRSGKRETTGLRTFQPTSLNLITGSAILLMIIMIASAFMLEGLACSIGIPNCD